MHTLHSTNDGNTAISAITAELNVEKILLNETRVPTVMVPENTQKAPIHMIRMLKNSISPPDATVMQPLMNIERSESASCFLFSRS